MNAHPVTRRTAAAPLLLLLSLAATGTAHAGRGEATRSAVYGRSGMVCAAQPLARRQGSRS